MAFSTGFIVAKPLPGGTLKPTTIPKFAAPLLIPPEMPVNAIAPDGTKEYEIAVRQFQQQILPPGFPLTTVWSYGSTLDAGTFQYPAFTIEASVDVTTRVRWINDLRD